MFRAWLPSSMGVSVGSPFGGLAQLARAPALHAGGSSVRIRYPPPKNKLKVMKGEIMRDA